MRKSLIALAGLGLMMMSCNHVSDAANAVANAADSAASTVGNAVKNVIGVDSLPQVARDVLAANFAGVAVDKVKAEYDGTAVKEYEVKLADGTEVEFNAAGVVEKVETANGVAVPAALVPAKVLAYVEANYPTSKITKYDVDRDKVEVKLTTGQELVFDTAYNFLRLDD